MIKKEFYKTREDGINLYRTYSDQGFLILQQESQAEYEEAIDIESNNYTYIETDKPIPIIENEEDIRPAFNILIGRDING